MTPVQSAERGDVEEMLATAQPSASPEAGTPADRGEIGAVGGAGAPAAAAEEPDGTPVGGGAVAVLRRGLRETPELRAGLAFTLALALLSAAGRLLVPVLTQQVLDRGILGAQGFRPALVYPMCAAAVAVVALVYWASRIAFLRLTRAAESALCTLRVRAFAHIHTLSMATLGETRRGTFVARVTSDVDQLSNFLDWGGINWVVSITQMVGCVVVMLIYSAPLTVLVLGVTAPLVLVMRLLQHGMLRAYDRLRTRVGETLGEVGESIMGAATVRAYGMQRRSGDRLDRAVRRQYQAEIGTAAYSATIFPASDLFGGIALAGVVAAGVTLGPGRGLSLGDLVAFLFLVNLFLGPLAELSELFDNTQTAVAGWRKVLGLLDVPADVVEATEGAPLPAGALDVAVEHVRFSYRGGAEALRGVDVAIAAGTHVAVVGATGSGKTTLATLLCRLADPTQGRVVVGGVDLRDASPASRRSAIRLVPQDGFLFDATVRDNVRFGAPEATDDDVETAFRELGLDRWAASLPDGLGTRTGERGENLSAGERQLVALVRAHIGQPGLLVLDEATSSVDPETERTIAEAMARVAAGRTTVTIAHRLSTARAADVVLVVDAGHIVERGDHATLVRSGGVYARLYSSWLGNTT